MKISDVVKSGDKTYKHHYMQTMTGEETCTHVLSAPQCLITLAETAPGADLIEFNDGTLGIEIDGKLWAAEMPHKEYRRAKSLPHEVWHYCLMALGYDGDTHAKRS